MRKQTVGGYRHLTSHQQSFSMGRRAGKLEAQRELAAQLVREGWILVPQQAANGVDFWYKLVCPTPPDCLENSYDAGGTMRRP